MNDSTFDKLSAINAELIANVKMGARAAGSRRGVKAHFDRR
jgi:hypothetical protein